MRAHKPSFVIISAALSTLSTEVNDHRHMILKQALNHDFKEVDGVYKGINEQSLVVTLASY